MNVLTARFREMQGLRQSEERLRALSEITTRPDLSFRERGRLLLQLGRRQFGLDGGAFCLLNCGRYEVAFAHPEGIFPPDIDLGDGGLFGREAEGPERSPNATSRQNAIPAFLPDGSGAYLIAPVRYGADNFGALLFFGRDARRTPYSHADWEFLRLIARWLGGDLARQKMEEAIRLSEARTTNILNVMSEVAWSATAEPSPYERRLLYLSESAEAVYGRPAADFLADSALRLAVIHPQDRDAAVAASARVLDEGLAEVEYRVLHPDSGAVHWIRDRARLIRDPVTGVPSRIDGITADITEEKRLRAQVVLSEKMAAIGELAAGVVHEINNPLTAVSGKAQLLMLHSDAQVREDGADIQAMVGRIERIGRALSTLAHGSGSEGADGCERREGESLNTAAEGALDLIRFKLHRASIQIHLELDPELPTAFLDIPRLEQVVLNLLANAEHALRIVPPDERRLYLRTFLAPPPVAGQSEAVCLSVADNGCGIPAAIRDRIFDPFFTTKEVGEGTGLGLALSRSIVAAHNGQLSVESEVGHGAIFTLSLPRTPPL